MLEFLEFIWNHEMAWNFGMNIHAGHLCYLLSLPRSFLRVKLQDL